MMPKGSEHHSSDITKLLYLGHSGAGKTGSLTSLVKAGYKLRIVDTDNLLAPLIAYVRKECPDKLDNIEFESLRDKFKATDQGPMVAGSPKAYVGCLKLMTTWSDGTIPAEWGPDTILVLDTLTTFSKSAFEWAKGLNPNAKDKRNWYWTAQQAISMNIDMLTSKGFNCNVIVIAHIKYLEEGGVTEGFANTIGSALSPEIATGFDTVVLAETKGSGSSVKRVIRTVPTSLVKLKNPKPFTIEGELPLETGLATIFEKLKEKE